MMERMHISHADESLKDFEKTKYVVLMMYDKYGILSPRLNFSIYIKDGNYIDVYHEILKISAMDCCLIEKSLQELDAISQTIMGFPAYIFNDNPKIEGYLEGIKIMEALNK